MQLPRGHGWHQGVRWTLSDLLGKLYLCPRLHEWLCISLGELEFPAAWRQGVPIPVHTQAGSILSASISFFTRAIRAEDHLGSLLALG